jgi:hypothetical protein
METEQNKFVTWIQVIVTQLEKEMVLLKGLDTKLPLTEELE